MSHDAGRTPSISIVTPSYNQGGFLADTIKSVIGQEGDFDLDYIIVDGGSTDNSVEIIRQYDQQIREGTWPVKCRRLRYRWLSEKDRGQADALAKGFALAQGEIFAWLNSDDLYIPGALRGATDFLRNHPETGLVYGDSHYCDSTGAIIGRYRTEAFDFDKLAWFNFICQPSAFFRRDVFEAVGGMDEKLQYAMDYDLWLRIGRHSPCRHLPRFLSMYRLHELSKTVRDRTLFENSEEALRLALRHFGWAPLTRVYNSCNFYCKSRLPVKLSRNKSALIIATITCSVLRSLWLNRGIHRNDLALLTRENVGKMFKSRLEIMTGPR